MLRTPVCVNSVPTIATESMSALRTNLLNSCPLDRLGLWLLGFDQSERGVPYQPVRGNALRVGYLRELGFLLWRELNFHNSKCCSMLIGCQGNRKA